MISQPNGQLSLPQFLRFRVLNPSRLLTGKALLGLLAFDLMGFGRNFAKMHSHVSRWRTAERDVPVGTVAQTCAAVDYACAWYPKRVLCLQRSAVTTCLLRHCGVNAKMAIGTQTLPFKAHAWTEVDGRPINERRDVGTLYMPLDRL